MPGDSKRLIALTTVFGLKDKGTDLAGMVVTLGCIYAGKIRGNVCGSSQMLYVNLVTAWNR